MEKILFRTLLLDYYGKLLTERQKEVFNMHYLDDLSLQEIGEALNISRQAAWDLASRTEKLLESYDKKLGLVAKGFALAELKQIMSGIGLPEDKKNRITELFILAEGDEDIGV